MPFTFFDESKLHLQGHRLLAHFNILLLPHQLIGQAQVLVQGNKKDPLRSDFKYKKAELNKKSSKKVWYMGFNFFCILYIIDDKEIC